MKNKKRGQSVLSKDMAEKWLRKNDPVFSSRKQLNYPYLSDRQMRERSEREIPISNLNFYFREMSWEKKYKELQKIIDLFS